MVILVPLGTGIVVLWPCILEAVNVVSSALSFGIPTTCKESQSGTQSGPIQNTRTGGNIRKVSSKTLDFKRELLSV